MKILKKGAVLAFCVTLLFAGADVYLTDNTKLPNIKMPNSTLSFKMIEGYQNYRVVATHFRTDKNELRYILANQIAYNALRKGEYPLPDGSKVVKIGWSVKKMKFWPAGLEADKIQRVEYMIKDSKRFNHNGDHWGYARFVKTKDGYKAWDKGVKSCIQCHSTVKESDYLFTKYQKRF